jgi:hypothetical protein
MDFDRSLESLATVPDHDLYRLALVVQRLLSDPRRIVRIRALLHLGQAVRFVDPSTGDIATGRIHALGARAASVAPDAQRTRLWEIPYPAIVTDPSAVPEAPQPRAPPVPPGAFELGEMASFTDKYGVTHVGRVTRRNTKTVTVDCEDATWRVPPRMLRRVVDV